ncbi:MAG: amidohydrolase family protein [Alphaproteobacteria bacterium]|nr:amidohydrolase family protein [Alphaproteobacteria bacterium]
MAESLVIRGGTVVDGTGGAPYEADVAIAGDRIAAIGKNLPKGGEEIDARGKLVTPGFVDVHTHYDAQVTWGSQISPSSWNGVTTVLIGNCGVGFAPCLPHQRDMLVKLMEGVEDIPEVVLTEGLPWNWQTFPQFLDALDARSYDLDVATQVPHAAVRVYVMGQRGAEREDATEKDRARMAQLAAEGIRAGALGFSTSRTIAHKTLAGEPTPTLGAAEAELAAIARAMRGVGEGWMQVISDFDDPEAEFAMLRRLVEQSGRPMTFSLLQREQRPKLWRELLDKVAEVNRAGFSMKAQVMGRPIGIMLGFEISQNPFIGRPSWQEVKHLPFAEKLAILRTPEFRARLLAEETGDPAMRHRVNTWEKIFPLNDPPDYEPPSEQSVAARAAREGRNPEDVAYDLLLERDGRAILYRPIINYADGTLDTVKLMMEDPNTILGLGDGGAHVSIICDASTMTTTLTHWARDRSRGARLPLEWVVKALSRDNAFAVGLMDRGVLAPGYKADVNVIDFDRLNVHAPEVRYDLPAGGRRLVQRTEGYEATIVSGVAVSRHGEATGALPGRLVRGAKSADAKRVAAE